MAKPVFVSLDQPNISIPTIALLVLPVEIRNLNPREDKSQSKGAKADRMAECVFWTMKRTTVSKVEKLAL